MSEPRTDPQPVDPRWELPFERKPTWCITLEGPCGTLQVFREAGTAQAAAEAAEAELNPYKVTLPPTRLA